MTEESKLLRQVKKYLKDKKVWCFRVQAQSNLFGLPDIMCLYKGVLIGLELKTDIGKATALQDMKLKEINKNGGIGIIARTLADVETLFDYIEYEMAFADNNADTYGFYDYWIRTGCPHYE